MLDHLRKSNRSDGLIEHAAQADKRIALLGNLASDFIEPNGNDVVSQVQEIPHKPLKPSALADIDGIESE